MRSNVTVGKNSNTAKSLTKSITRAAVQVLEQLEGRRLLAANPYDFRNTPVFTPTTNDLSNVKSGPLAKGGADLVSLYTEYTRFVKKGGDRYQFQSANAARYEIRGRDILLTVRTRGNIDALVTDIKSMGGTIVYRSKGKRVVDAFVPLNQVTNLATRKEILHLRPQLRKGLLSQGDVSNDAERSQKTEFVTPAFGVDGTGQKVGVISDSFFAGGIPADGEQRVPSPSELTGDLPFADLPDYLLNLPYDLDVDVLEDEPGTDEGRAMLELIYDLAPGAELAYHTAGVSQNTFAEAIFNLREAESTVIVDDVYFFDEPFFGEGVIDRAINDVVDDGANYLTANGNSGFAGYSKAVTWVDEEGSDGNIAADFDNSGKVDTKLDVHFNRAGELFFQWDNAYDGVVGNVTADVDFYLYRAGALISSSVDDNFATGVPVEHVIIPEGGDFEIVLRMAKLEKGADAPTFFKFVSRDNDMFDARKDIEYGSYNNATFGHSGATRAIPVGAVDNAASNAFGTARDLASQDFSSAGPQIRVFDANGNRLAEPEIRLTPLVSGIQGTNTSVEGFAPFFGTSAAAPNVAAVAALLRQIDPDAAPETIKQALVTSAKANPLNGKASGEWDSQGGFGLVDAVLAASILNPDVPISTFSVANSTSGGVGSVVVNFSEPVTGVDISDFTLTRDGTSRNRFTGSENIVSSNGGRTYTITNLKSATSTLAVYTITLRNARTDIEDDEGNPAAGNVVSFDVTLRRPGNLLADSLDDGQIRLRWTDTSSSEDNYRIQRATDAAFSEGVRNIDVGGGSTSYVDSDVTPGEVYYYRVRAAKGGRLGDVARVTTVASSAGEIFIDDRDAKLSGGWARYGNDDAYLQTISRASETSALSGTANTATFASDDIATGLYFVYTRYTSTSKNATNASYEILQGSKVITTVKLDQTMRGGGWVLLGKFASLGAGGLSVRLTSAGANGSVTADGMRFLPADEATIAAFQTQKRKQRNASNAGDLV